MELTQGVRVTADTSDATANLEKAARAADSLGDSLDKTEKAAKSSGLEVNQLERGLDQLERRIVRVAAEFLIFKGIVEGLKAADRVNDLLEAVDNVTGSVGRGAEALKFFQSVQYQTAATATELLKTYKDIAGISQKAGFTDSRELQKFTVELTNVGKAAGLSTDQIKHLWETVVLGTGRSNLDVLASLGFTRENLKNVDTFMAKVHELAPEAEKMAFTFESTMKKIGDAWVLAFNPGATSAREAYQKIFQELTRPEILDLIHDIGKAIIEILPKLAIAITAAMATVRIAFGETLGTLSKIAEAMALFVGTSAQKMRELFAENNKAFVGSAADKFLAGIEKQAGRDMLTAGSLGEYSINQLVKGVADLQKIIDGMNKPAVTPPHVNTVDTARPFSLRDTTKEEQARARRELAAQQEVARMEKMYESLHERIAHVFDIDEGETPLSRKIKQLTSDAAQFAIALREKMLESANIIFGGQAAGVDPAVIREATKLLAEYGQEADNIAPKLKRALANVEFNEAIRVTELWREGLVRVNRILSETADNARRVIDAMRQSGGANDPFAAQATSAQAALQQSALVEAAVIRAVGRLTDEKPEVTIRKLEENARHYHEASVEMLKAAQEFDSVFAKFLRDPMANVITDLIEGGKSFGTIAAKFFQDGIAAGGKQISNVFSKAILDVFKVDTSPQKPDETNAVFNARVSSNTELTQRIGQAFTTAIGGAQQFADVVAGKIHQSFLSGVASQTVAGASIGSVWGIAGTVIGAVVGAVIGIVQGLISPSVGKDYKYASGIGFDAQGRATFQPNQNLSTDEVNRMLQALNTVAQSFFSGYTKILLKFPLEILPGLLTTFANMFGAGAMNANYGLFENKGTDFGMAASEHFMAHFDAFVQKTLPDKIYQAFRPMLVKAFESVGLTSDRFADFEAAFKNLDPKASAQAWGDLADALMGFKKASDYAANIRGFDRAFDTGKLLNADGSVRGGVTDFEQSVIEATPDLVRLGLAVKTLVGPEQAAAAKALADGMNTMWANLVQYLNKLIQMSKTLSDSISTDKFDIALQMATDPKAKSKLLEGRLNEDFYRIQNAKMLGLSPDEVQTLVNDARSLIKQIFNIDPTGRAGWATTTLDLLDSVQKEAFQRFGDEAVTAVQKLMKDLEPIVNAFKGIGTNATTGMTALAAATTTASTKLGEFAIALGTAIGTVNTVGSGTSRSSQGASINVQPSTTEVDVVVTIDINDPQGFVQAVRSHRVSRQM